MTGYGTEIWEEMIELFPLMVKKLDFRFLTLQFKNSYDRIWLTAKKLKMENLRAICMIQPRSEAWEIKDF